MAPPARIDRALMSSGVNPTWGPMRVVAARSAAVISALRTVDQAAPLKTAARCVSGVAPCCRRCATRRLMAVTAHDRECPVAPCPMDSPLTPFFCVVKRRLTKVAASQVAAEAVVAWKGWVPTKNWMSRRGILRRRHQHRHHTLHPPRHPVLCWHPSFPSHHGFSRHLRCRHLC